MQGLAVSCIAPVTPSASRALTLALHGDPMTKQASAALVRWTKEVGLASWHSPGALSAGTLHSVWHQEAQ